MPRTPFRCSGSADWSWIPDCAPSSRARARLASWRRPRSRCLIRCLNRSMPGTLPWPMPSARRASSVPMSRTAQALATGAGNALAGGTWIVVAAHGQVLLARRLPHGAAAPEVRVGPLPHLLQAAAFAARRPAHVVLLADRGDAAVIAHTAGDQRPARRFGAPGAQRDTHPDRPPAQHHGERHVTGSESESGGERNAASIAARVSEAAASVGAHIVLGAGDQHILDAVRGPPARCRSVRSPRSPQARCPRTATSRSAPGSAPPWTGSPARPSAPSGTWLPHPPQARLTGSMPSPSSWPSSRSPCCSWRPTSHGTATARATGSGAARPSSSSATRDAGTEVPLEDGLTWAALHQDAIIVRLPDRSGPLAGQPVAALLRRG